MPWPIWKCAQGMKISNLELQTWFYMSDLVTRVWSLCHWRANDKTKRIGFTNDDGGEDATVEVLEAQWPF